MSIIAPELVESILEGIGRQSIHNIVVETKQVSSLYSTNDNRTGFTM